MGRFISRAVFVMLLAAAAAHADLPTVYRVALIQARYGSYGPPVRYTTDQLKAAAKEMSDYFAQISYGHLFLQFEVSSVNVPPVPCSSCIFPEDPVTA